MSSFFHILSIESKIVRIGTISPQYTKVRVGNRMAKLGIFLTNIPGPGSTVRLSLEIDRYPLTCVIASLVMDFWLGQGEMGLSQDSGRWKSTLCRKSYNFTPCTTAPDTF